MRHGLLIHSGQILPQRYFGLKMYKCKNLIVKVFILENLLKFQLGNKLRLKSTCFNKS